MRVQLEEEVTAQRLCKVRVRPTLYASKCDACGKVFKMKPYCNDEGLAYLKGTFQHCATDPETKKGMGNGFSATVCSFKCAHEVFANGGWRKMPEYKPYADADIKLIRCELKITSFVLDEQEIREEWGKIDQMVPTRIEWAEILPE